MFFQPQSRACLGRVAFVVAAAMTLLVASGCSRGAAKPADSILAPDREVLVQYEAMRAALADDDVRKAHVAGEKLLKSVDATGVSAGLTKARSAAKIMSESYRIDVLRSAFKEFSGALVPLCQGVEGLYIVSTDLVVDGVWVQNSRVISNPYLGRSMGLYGEIKK
jgi:hypothetical protein